MSTESGHVVLTSAGTLLVAADEFLGPDMHGVLLAEFDAAGVMQWSRHETSLYPTAGLDVDGMVPALGGGMFVHWWFGGDHDAWTAAARYDAAGSRQYAMKAHADYIMDIAVGPNGDFYSLEIDHDNTIAEVVPHVP